MIEELPFLPRVDTVESVYNAIQTLTQERGLPPIFREIAREADLSIDTVLRSLVVLEERGYLTIAHGNSRKLSRTMRLVKPFDRSAEDLHFEQVAQARREKKEKASG